MATGTIKTIKQDTGWIVLNPSYSLVRYRKIGNIVYIHAKHDANVSGNITFGTLPLGYRPSQMIAVNNYSGNTFVRVDENGVLLRGGTGDSWLNAMLIYPVG